MSLDRRGIASTLSELDNLLTEVRIAVFDENVDAERAALRAAQRAVTQLDSYLTERLEEIATDPQEPTGDGP